MHHRKITKAAWATKAKDRILRTSSSLYSSLEGFQRKSYCPWNGRFRVVSDLRPASPAKSGVRRAALPRFVGPSRSHPPSRSRAGEPSGLIFLSEAFQPPQMKPNRYHHCAQDAILLQNGLGNALVGIAGPHGNALASPSPVKKYATSGAYF